MSNFLFLSTSFGTHIKATAGLLFDTSFKNWWRSCSTSSSSASLLTSWSTTVTAQPPLLSSCLIDSSVQVERARLIASRSFTDKRLHTCSCTSGGSNSQLLSAPTISIWQLHPPL